MPAEEAPVQRRRTALLACAAALAVLGLTLVFWLQQDAEQAVPGQPEAVLLIPGYGGDREPLEALRAALTDAGYLVEVLDIGTGTGDLRGYAHAAEERAETLLGGGAGTVSTVGFSAGGLIGRIAAIDDPALFAEVVSIAAPHRGTALALLGGPRCPLACQQMKPGSDLLAGLPDAAGPARWLSLYSQTDEVIVPARSSELPGATVQAIQQVCTDAAVSHGQVPSDPWVVAAVSAFLADRPLPAQCPA